MEDEIEYPVSFEALITIVSGYWWEVKEEIEYVDPREKFGTENGRDNA
jgi:hypothetical protein